MPSTPFFRLNSGFKGVRWRSFSPATEQGLAQFLLLSAILVASILLSGLGMVSVAAPVESQIRAENILLKSFKGKP